MDKAHSQSETPWQEGRQGILHLNFKLSSCCLLSETLLVKHLRKVWNTRSSFDRIQDSASRHQCQDRKGQAGVWRSTWKTGSIEHYRVWELKPEVQVLHARGSSKHLVFLKNLGSKNLVVLNLKRRNSIQLSHSLGVYAKGNSEAAIETSMQDLPYFLCELPLIANC